ncbi:peroxidase 56-like [Wolffia australiana]
MAPRAAILTLFLYSALSSFLFKATDAGKLRVEYYQKTCPEAESVVQKTVASFIAQDATIAAPLLRLHFHDCFVRGCDGSVLLDSVMGQPAEKDAAPNLSLDGFNVIEAAKAAVESVCPGIVSCADILAIASRDGVALNGGPSWEVETGRRDGRVSRASEAVANLPSSFANIGELKANFARKGLNSKDLAILSGAHTIGTSRCSSLSSRLYNFTGKGDSDPSLNPPYASSLRTQCKQGDQSSVVDMDPGSAVNFDTSYYRGVATGRGLFVSDAALLNDKLTKTLVYQYSRSTPTFFRDFGAAMVKMGRVGVLTGKQGEIRQRCMLVNA